jgi:tetratricopeptide (TPR) repeat protein
MIARRHGHLVVKLTDLGLAREAADDEFRVTREGSTVGSIDYMAPEQARDSRAADTRSDLYSLGCTLYHMLAGRPPFAEGGLTERLFKHIEAEPPDILQSNPDTTPELVRALKRLLAKKPEDRYQTPAELLADLARGAAPAGRDAGSSDAIPPGPPAATPSSSATLLEGPPPTASAVPAASQTPRPANRPDPSPPSLPGVGQDQRRAAAGQFERAGELLAHGNYDYAIRLLRSCCKLDPTQLPYRQMLRQAEKRKFHNDRPGGPFTWLAKRPSWLRLKAAGRRKNYIGVLAAGEDVLARDPWDVGAQLDMADAADRLSLTELAVWLLEEARQKDVRDARVNRALARLYEKAGNLGQAIALWDLVRKVDPTDAEAHQKTQDLAARETIRRGRYFQSVQRGSSGGSSLG